MEQVRDKHKIEHQRYTIQYNDKAISNLKWNKEIWKKLGFFAYTVLTYSERINIINNT